MWKWVVGALALAGAVGGTVSAFRGLTSPPVPPPARPALTSPYARAIAGAGLVEPAGEYVVVGVPEAGLVTRLWVASGSVVRRGDPLFQLDPRPLEAQEVVAEAAIASAEAELARVRAHRRPEEEPALAAKVREAEAAVSYAREEVAAALASQREAELAAKDLEARRARASALLASRAVSEEVHEAAHYAAAIADARSDAARAHAGTARAHLAVAEARSAQARADLDVWRAGPWEPDLLRAQAALAEARARREQIRRDLERRTVRAPRDGTVLRCEIHEGEHVAPGERRADDAPMVLGDVSRLCVRVDVDEFDAARFDPVAAATAFPRGQAGAPLPLELVAVEPMVVPKRALTNSQKEYVDARVLEVVYAIVAPDPRLHPGQQVDVFVEARGSDAPPAALPDGPVGPSPASAPR